MQSRDDGKDIYDEYATRGFILIPNEMPSIDCTKAIRFFKPTPFKNSEITGLVVGAMALAILCPCSLANSRDDVFEIWLNSFSCVVTSTLIGFLAQGVHLLLIELTDCSKRKRLFPRFK